MKQLLFLIFILPLITYSLSLFNKDKLWSTMYGAGGNCGQFYCWSYYTKISSDTIIDGTSYKIVLNSSDSLMSKWSVAGFARESNQQVFFRHKEMDNECLLYDFGCSVGDTLKLNCWCLEGENEFKVDSLVYKTVFGQTRKHIFLSHLLNGSKEMWIEGIGSTSGILNGGGPNNCITGDSESLLCCYENGTEIFHHADYNNCFLGPRIIDAVISDLNKSPNITIYPNPAIDFITIKSHSNVVILKAELCDLTGICCYRISDNRANTLNINISNFPKGMYILMVQTQNEELTEKILIK